MTKNNSKNNKNLTFSGNRSDNEKDFAKFKSQLARKMHSLKTKSGISDWDYYINSTEENQRKSESNFVKFLELLSDKKVYKRLLNFDKKGINDKTLKRTIKDLIKDYKLNVTDVELAKQLQKSENKIAAKVNAYKGKIDGKEYSNADLTTILQKEKNEVLRKKAYDARFTELCGQVAPDIVELVKQRNVYAKKKGFDNYFSFMLKEQFKVDEKELFKTLDNVIEQTMPIFELMQKEKNKYLTKTFGIKENDLRAWHYGLLSDDNPKLIADKYIKDNKSMENIVYNMYKQMGWDVKSLPIVLDLYPKPNKNQHGFCFDLDPNKDARILANLKNDVNSAETLAHEMGHSVYALKYSKRLQYFDQDTHCATTEAVAMMMESVPNREGFYVKELNLPKDLAEKMEVERLKDSLKFMHHSAVLMNFEKSMYENPEQDLAKLWFSLKHKFQLQNMPEKFINEWASIPHFLSNPAYYQNYFRAEIMQNQFYDTAKGVLGNLTENKNTAKFFEQKLFKFGTSLEEPELLKKFTGSSLNSEALCKSYKKILKYIK